MSETLSYDAIVTSGPETADFASPEFNAEQAAEGSEDKKSNGWERDDLTPLVQANAHVLVECGWMPGGPVTVGEAMNNYPGWALVTEETQDVAIAAVLELLARQVIEAEEEDELQVEEPTEAPAAEKKSDTETEVRQVRENSKKADAKARSEQEVDKAERPAPVADKAGATPRPADGMKAVKAAAAASTPSDTVKLTDISKTPSAASITTESPTPPAVTDKADREFVSEPAAAENRPAVTTSAAESTAGTTRRIPAFKAPEAFAVDPIVAADPALTGRQPAVGQEPELLTPLEITEETFAELADPAEEAEARKEEPALVAIGHQIDIYISFDSEDELLTSDFNETGLASDEQYEIFDMPTAEAADDSLEAEELNLPLRSELGLSEQVEADRPEQLIPAGLTVETIEDSLMQVAESIEASPPETAEKINEILDKIIEVPAKLKASDKETITEADAQAELEELFVELFDNAGIDHTPELIESLARLTLKWHLADEIGQLKTEEETDKAPQAGGTHEIIRKLLAGLSIIKKAITHASAIGKSALQLYIFNFAV